ncbi:MAG: flavodoxin-dependent (E)-4-hydroxy-3-methylbut-2-enyl-diphosphate synthase [Oscillospiraceae bacterium]
MATKKINVGGITIGGGAPITVQSMTNVKTEDVAATLSQIERLAAAGCDIVRLAVPTMEAAAALGPIRERSPVPIVADIHFDYKLALEAVKMGVDKIRINPGNIGGEDKVRAVANACRKKNIPIRIGVNGGSLEEDLLQRYGLTAEAMYMSAMGHVKLLNKFDFNDICISVKASDVMLTVEAYRMMAEKTDYPLHLGVTEAGTEYMGIMRSAAGIGTLLTEGIGDTIRISLTAPPEREAIAGVALLKALGIRSDGVRIISCPSCGRCNIDLIGIAGEIEKRLAGVHKDCTVAVMGCAVNGPGEAREADFGMAGGKGEGLLFKNGKIVKKVPMALIVDELMAMVTES